MVRGLQADSGEDHKRLQKQVIARLESIFALGSGMPGQDVENTRNTLLQDALQEAVRCR